MNSDPPGTPPRTPPRPPPVPGSFRLPVPPRAPIAEERFRAALRPPALHIPPVNQAALLEGVSNDPPVYNFRRRAAVRPIDPYNNPIHYGVRNVPAGTENAITYDNIINGANMVNFHGEMARTNEPRYYTHDTFRAFPVNAQGFRLNPFTRRRIYPHEVDAYTARIPIAPARTNVPVVGVKRTRNGSPRGGKRSRRHRRRHRRRHTRRT